LKTAEAFQPLTTLNEIARLNLPSYCSFQRPRQS
jgi:hypothetical protein